MLTLLINPWFVAFGIPTMFLACGGLAKKLIRGQGAWKASDWFLGVELTLGSMAASLIHIFDLLKKAPASGDWPENLLQQVGVAAALVAICFFGFLWVVTTHQNWEGAKADQKIMRPFLLCGMCNGIGFLCMFALIFAQKGI